MLLPRIGLVLVCLSCLASCAMAAAPQVVNSTMYRVNFGHLPILVYEVEFDQPMYVAGVSVATLEGAQPDRPAIMLPSKPSLAGTAMIKCGATTTAASGGSSFKASGLYPDWDQNEATWTEQVTSGQIKADEKYKKVNGVETDLLGMALQHRKAACGLANKADEDAALAAKMAKTEAASTGDAKDTAMPSKSLLSASKGRVSPSRRSGHANKKPDFIDVMHKFHATRAKNTAGKSLLLESCATDTQNDVQSCEFDSCSPNQPQCPCEWLGDGICDPMCANFNDATDCGMTAMGSGGAPVGMSGMTLLNHNGPANSPENCGNAFCPSNWKDDGLCDLCLCPADFDDGKDCAAGSNKTSNCDANCALTGTNDGNSGTAPAPSSAPSSSGQSSAEICDPAGNCCPSNWQNDGVCDSGACCTVMLAGLFNDNNDCSSNLTTCDMNALYGGGAGGMGGMDAPGPGMSPDAFTEDQICDSTGMICCPSWWQTDSVCDKCICPGVADGFDESGSGACAAEAEDSCDMYGGSGGPSMFAGADSEGCQGSTMGTGMDYAPMPSMDYAPSPAPSSAGCSSDFDCAGPPPDYSSALTCNAGVCSDYATYMDEQGMSSETGTDYGTSDTGCAAWMTANCTTTFPYWKNDGYCDMCSCKDNFDDGSDCTGSKADNCDANCMYTGGGQLLGNTKGRKGRDQQKRRQARAKAARAPSSLLSMKRRDSLLSVKRRDQVLRRNKHRQAHSKSVLLNAAAPVVDPMVAAQECFKTNADGVAHSNMAWLKDSGMPPGHLIGAPSIEDPAAGWMSGFQGYILNETKKPNVISFMTLNVDWLGLYSTEPYSEWFKEGTCSEDDLKDFEPPETCGEGSTDPACYPPCDKHEVQDCEPMLTFPDSIGGVAITNEDGDAFTGDVSFTGRLLEPACTSEGITSVKNALGEFTALFDDVSGAEELTELENMMVTFESRKGFVGCKMLGGSFVIDGPQEINVTTSECVLEPMNEDGTENAEFMSDPCCNDNLKYTQCCMPKTVTGFKQAVQGFNIERMRDVCKEGSQDNSGQMMSTLRDFVDAQEGSDGKAETVDDLWERYAGFVHECWINIEDAKSVTDQETCNSNSDCYSKVCITVDSSASGGGGGDSGGDGKTGKAAVAKPSSKVCKNKEEDRGPSLVSCLVDRMDPLLRREYLSTLGLNETTATKEEFSKRFVASVSGEDCIGVGAEPFKSRMEMTTFQDTGEMKMTVIPGDPARCVSQKECNGEPQFRVDQSSCEGDGKQTMCEECFGDFCYDKSVPSACVVSGIDIPGATSDFMDMMMYGMGPGMGMGESASNSAPTCFSAVQDCSSSKAEGGDHYFQNGWKDQMHMYNSSSAPSKLKCKEATSMDEVGTTVCTGNGPDCCVLPDVANGEDPNGCTECSVVYGSADGRCSTDGQTFSELPGFDFTIFPKYSYSMPVDTKCAAVPTKCAKYYSACAAQPDNTGAPGGQAKLVNKFGSYTLECHMPSLNSLDGCMPSPASATASDAPSLSNFHVPAIQHVNPTFQSSNHWDSAGFYSWTTGFCFSTTLKTEAEATAVFGEWGMNMNPDNDAGFYYGYWDPDMRNNNGVFKVPRDTWNSDGVVKNIEDCKKLSENNANHAFQWYPGRTYSGGQWANEAECNVGTCSIGEAYKYDHTLKRYRLTTAAECDARASCNGVKYGSCPKCFEKDVVDRDEKQLCFGKPTGVRLAVTRTFPGVATTTKNAGGVVFPFINNTAKTPLITCPEGTAIKAVAVKEGGGYSLGKPSSTDGSAHAAPSSTYSFCWDASLTLDATTCAAKGSAYTWGDLFKDGLGEVCSAPYNSGPCSGHGSLLYGDASCVCDAGYSGSSCDISSVSEGLSSCNHYFGAATETPAIWHGRYYRCYDATSDQCTDKTAGWTGHKCSDLDKDKCSSSLRSCNGECGGSCASLQPGAPAAPSGGMCTTDQCCKGGTTYDPNDWNQEGCCPSSWQNDGICDWSSDPDMYNSMCPSFAEGFDDTIDCPGMIGLLGAGGGAASSPSWLAEQKRRRAVRTARENTARMTLSGSSAGSRKKLLFHETETYTPPTCPDDGDGDRLSSTADFLGFMAMDGGSATAVSAWSEFVGLTCAFNENAPCAEAECAERGICPDQSIQNEKDILPTGSCVFPHIANEFGTTMQCSVLNEGTGQRELNENQPHMKALKCNVDKFGTAETNPIGCKFIDQRLTTGLVPPKFQCSGGTCDWFTTGICTPSDCTVAKVDCAEAGGKWYEPASTQAGCDAHGSACFSQEHGFNGKDAETCTGCKEEFRPFFKYQPAVWSEGSMRKHRFTTYKWEPVRQWGDTVVLPKFAANLENVVTRLIGRLFISAAVQKYNPVLDIFNTLGCACTEGLSDRVRPITSYNEGVRTAFAPISTCFNVSDVLFGRQKAYVGVSTMLTVPGVSVNATFTKPFISEDNVTGEEVVRDNADVTFKKIGAGQMSLPPDESKTTTKDEAAAGDSKDDSSGTGLLASVSKAATKLLSAVTISGYAPKMLPVHFEKETVWSDRYPGYDRFQKHSAFGFKRQTIIRAVVDTGAITPRAGAKLLAEEEGDTTVVSAKSTPDQWAVVRDECNLFVIGQLVGNGFAVNFDPEPTENVEICVAVRFDIPQDTTLYPFKDFANAREDGSVGWPQQMEVTSAADNAPFCAMVNKSGTYFPIIRRDFTAGNYTWQFLLFTFMMLVCCACSVTAAKKTKPAVRARTRTLALWTCAACFISFVMVVVLIPALVPGQCPPVSGWGYVYGFAGLCISGCMICTCMTICVCLKGNGVDTEIEEQADPKGEM